MASSRFSLWPTSVVCIVSSCLSAVIVLLVVHLVVPPNSRSSLSLLSRDERPSPNDPRGLGDIVAGREKRSLGDLPFYLSAHSAYEQGVFLNLFKAVKANETFYSDTMKILMPALVQFESVVIKEFRSIRLLIRRYDIRMRQWSTMMSSHKFLQTRKPSTRDDYYDDYDYEGSEAKKKTKMTTTTTTTTSISTTTMTTTVSPEEDGSSSNETSSEGSDEIEGGGTDSSEEETEGKDSVDCPCVVRSSTDGSEEDRDNSTHTSLMDRNGTLSEDGTSSDNSTEADWTIFGSALDEDFENKTKGSPNATDHEGDSSTEDPRVNDLANGTSLTLTDGEFDPNNTNIGYNLSRVSLINNTGAHHPAASETGPDGNAGQDALYDGEGYGINGTQGIDGWNSTDGNGTLDYYDYDDAEGNATLDATGDTTGDDATGGSTGDAVDDGASIKSDGVTSGSTVSRESVGRGSSGEVVSRVLRPRFDPTPIYRRLNEHSTRIDSLKVAMDARSFKDKELDFKLAGLETAEKDQNRRLREMETDNHMVTSKMNDLLAKVGLGNEDYRTLSITVGKVQRDVTDVKDSLTEMEADWQELRLNTNKQSQIITELRTADSYKAHSIREVANLMNTMQSNMQHVLSTVDSYLSGLREEITKQIENICYNNELQCY